MTRNDLHERGQRALEEHRAARAELGEALLDGSDDVPQCRDRLLRAERELADVDLMSAAYEARQRDAVSNRVYSRKKKAPRVPQQQYHAERVRFQRDYPTLRRSAALLDRAAELLRLAKASGQMAVDDCKATFRNYGASPQLAKLLPNDN